MGSNRIKGLTIEIGGDTTKLDKALSGTNKQLKDTQAQLKDVERLLKLDPGNVELMDQKQRLLAQSVDATTEKLKTLKQTAETSTVSNVQYTKWEKSFASLQGKITMTSNELSKLEDEGEKLKELGFAPDSEPMVEVQQKAESLRKKIEGLNKKVTDTYKELGRPISIDQWDALQREISETETSLKDVEKASKALDTSLGKMSPVFSDVSGKAEKVSSAFAPVSKAVLAVGAAAIATVPATEEFRAGLSMLDNNARMAGVGIGAVRESFERFNVVSNEVDSSIEATSNLLQAGFTESNLQLAVENLAGAYLSFPDTLKIESLADSLQETIATGEATGQFAELLGRLGINVEAFSTQMGLLTNGIERQDFALTILSRTGLRESYTSWMQNNQALTENRESTLALQQSISNLAEDIQPFLTTLAEMASTFLNWFNEIPDGAKAAVVGIGAFLAIVSPIASIISSITAALSAAGVASTVFSVAGTSVSFTLGQWLLIIGLVIAAVLALAAAIAFLTGRSKELKELEMPEVPDYSGVVTGRGQPSPQPSGGRMRTASAENIPHLARGAVTRVNSPFLAVVGDNPTQREIIAPESAIQQAVSRGMAASGGGHSGPISVNITFAGDLAQLGRVLNPVITAEGQRLGPHLVNS